MLLNDIFRRLGRSCDLDSLSDDAIGPQQGRRVTPMSRSRGLHDAPFYSIVGESTPDNDGEDFPMRPVGHWT